MAAAADPMMVADTEKRLRSHKGVLGLMVINNDGVPIRSTLEDDMTTQLAALVSRYIDKCKSCTKKLREDDDLQLVRIRSAKHEIVIAPDYGDSSEQYTLAVVQDPTEGPSAM